MREFYKQYYFDWETKTLFSKWLLNPLRPDIHLQILQTDIHTFP